MSDTGQLNFSQQTEPLLLVWPSKTVVFIIVTVLILNLFGGSKKAEMVLWAINFLNPKFILTKEQFIEIGKYLINLHSH